MCGFFVGIVACQSVVSMLAYCFLANIAQTTIEGEGKKYYNNIIKMIIQNN